MRFNILGSQQPESHKRKAAYKFGRLIGKGGYGEVKLATWVERDNKVVAVKIVPKSAIRSVEQQVDRMNALLRFDHPHIYRLFEWYESSKRYFMVFEPLLGGELYDRLMSAGRFAEHDAKLVMRSIFSALAYLHGSMRVVHRDIKLENVMYRSGDPTSQGYADVALTDFGLAHVFHEDEEERLHSVCGSPCYGAPEIMLEESYSYPVDVWSAGVLAFALLAGRFPFKETEQQALALEARSMPLKFPPDPWSSISEQCRDFLRRVLDPYPGERATAEQAMNHPWIQGGPSSPLEEARRAHDGVAALPSEQGVETQLSSQLTRVTTTVSADVARAAM